MRTKTLLLTAALAAAGIATSMAQSNVYSLNVVGYVTITNAPNKFAIVANPLNTTNNDVSQIFPNGATYPGLTVYKRNASGGYDTATFDPDLGGWSRTLDIPPGVGVWIFTPPGIPYTNVFVGEVIQVSTNTLPVGFSIRSSVVPQSAPLVAPAAGNMGFPYKSGDAFYFLNATGAYDTYLIDPDLGTWTRNDPTGPVPNVAQGFWYFNSGATATNWVRNFTIP